MSVWKFNNYNQKEWSVDKTERGYRMLRTKKLGSPESQVADTDSFNTLSGCSNIMATCFNRTQNIYVNLVIK